MPIRTKKGFVKDIGSDKLCRGEVQIENRVSNKQCQILFRMFVQQRGRGDGGVCGDDMSIELGSAVMNTAFFFRPRKRKAKRSG